jgi:hypothetical protein
MRHAHLGEQAKRCKARCHSEDVYVDATGMWEESDRAIPGEISTSVRGDHLRREAE